jgi:hypothetical protein
MRVRSCVRRFSSNRQLQGVYNHVAYAGTWGSAAYGGAFSHEFSAGYDVDCHGKAGPILAVVLTCPVGDFELGLRAAYDDNIIDRSPGRTALFAGSLSWFF